MKYSNLISLTFLIAIFYVLEIGQCGVLGFSGKDTERERERAWVVVLLLVDCERERERGDRRGAKALAYDYP